MVSIAILLFSCTASHKVVYFNDIKDGTYYSSGEQKEVPIAPHDILSINISSLNKEASDIFNQTNEAPVGTTAVGYSNSVKGGYLVDPQGNIQLPVLGLIKAAGLTKEELKNSITKQILDKKLLKDPLVDVRFLNYEVTVLGEVGKPTVITVPNEKISMLKAIGMAGDLTIYGIRKNVLLIRDVNGEKITRHVDLTSSDFLSSPYYYLQPNDIVYVQPNKAKVNQSTMWPQMVPILLTALSVSVIVLDRLLR